jgi:hypothetical protein
MIEIMSSILYPRHIRDLTTHGVALDQGFRQLHTCFIQSLYFA